MPAGEHLLGRGDVEAAVEEVIRRDDLLAAVHLAEHVVKLPPFVQVLIKTKIRLHFKRDGGLFDQALREAAKGGELPPPPPADSDSADSGSAMGPDLLHYPLTESGNGERMVALCGQDIRHCTEMKKWLVWDGRRWAIDSQRVIRQKAKQMARLLHAQATGRYPEHEKWARKSESARALNDLLDCASTEKGMPAFASELDQHPYLLNCLNGVIDLRNGQLLPHDRDYLITKLCHVTYDAKAECPRFRAFVDWAMGANLDSEPSERTAHLVGFLQRALGYSLTADVSEKVVFVCYGPKGNNGKTTLLTTFKGMLSEYSTQISIETLMTTRTQDAGLRADLGDLRGARFAITSEVEQESRLSVGKLKYITGGADSEIKSCKKYENPIEFTGQHHLWMDCNYRPGVLDPGDAIWSRLKPIPFLQRINREDPEYDKKLKQKLDAEREGILAWAVRGCQLWFEHGLGDPPEIAEASQEWREHDDPLKGFLEDCCDVADALWDRSKLVSDAYTWWCREERIRFPLGGKKFHELLLSKGFRTNRSRRDADGLQLRTLEGLEVKSEVRKKAAAMGKVPGALVID